MAASSWPDATVITAAGAVAVLIIGALVRGTVLIIRALFRELRAIHEKADTAIAQNQQISEKADTAIEQTNGNMSKMQEQLDKQIARADTLQDMLLSTHKLLEAMKPTAVVVTDSPIVERRVRQEDLDRSKGSKG